MENSDSTTNRKTAGETISNLFFNFWVLPLILIMSISLLCLVFDIDGIEITDPEPFKIPFIIYCMVGFIFAAITGEQEKKEERSKKQQKKLRKKEEKRAEKLAIFKEQMKEWEKTNEGPMPPQM